MRQLILVRHGQYATSTGRLTALGRRQVEATARALRGIEISAIHTSTMPRAVETAEILRTLLRCKSRIRTTALLCEAIPTRMPGRTTPDELAQIRRDFRRMKRAYAELVRPARGARSELIVAHGNLIRLLVCLALGVDPTTWLKMRTDNCGITVLTVDRSKKVLVSFNDTGHLPPKLRTVS